MRIVSLTLYWSYVCSTLITHDTPGYSEVPVNIKKVLYAHVMRGHPYYSTYFRPIVTGRRRAQHEVLK